MNILFLDIDGVMVDNYSTIPSGLPYEYGFDADAVQTLNAVLNLTGAEIVVSSDWRLEYYGSIPHIFNLNRVVRTPIDVTENHWGSRFKKADDLEACRASEILTWVAANKSKIQNWVALDDLYLGDFIPDKNFVHCLDYRKGINAPGISDALITALTNKE